MPSNPHKWQAPPDPTPAQLERAAGGDAEAFRQIVERYQGMVYSIAYNMFGNQADAEDAAQEVFLRLYRKLARFAGTSSFSTWFYRFTLNAVVDHQRRQRRIHAADAAVGATGAAHTGAPAGEAMGDAEGEALDRVAYGELMAALAELPLDYRAPLVLRDVYGLSYREISGELDRPLGTVKAMVHRGRNALRLRLRAAGATEEE
jgi:RNA polymerase sigma-70 factor (ECF subfamily)